MTNNKKANKSKKSTSVKKQTQGNKNSTITENIKKSGEAVAKLEKAGYTVGGSPTGVVTVFKTRTRTLISGQTIKETLPVWRGKSYIEASKLLLKSAKKPKSATPAKKTTGTKKK